MDNLPFMSVESKDFRNLVWNLRKDAFIPSADTIKNEIMSIFDDSLKKIRHILQVSILYIMHILYILIYKKKIFFNFYF